MSPCYLIFIIRWISNNLKFEHNTCGAFGWAVVKTKADLSPKRCIFMKLPFALFNLIRDINLHYLGLWLKPCFVLIQYFDIYFYTAWMRNRHLMQKISIFDLLFTYKTKHFKDSWLNVLSNWWAADKCFKRHKERIIYKSCQLVRTGKKPSSLFLHVVWHRVWESHCLCRSL